MYMQRLFKLEIRSIISVLSHLGIIDIPLRQHPNLLGHVVSVALGHKASYLGINAAGVIRGWRPLFAEMKWMYIAIVRKNRMRKNREIFKKYIVALETPS
jgi:hypothetical protein